MTSRGGRGLEIFSTLQYLMADFKFLSQTLALVSELGRSLFRLTQLILQRLNVRLTHTPTRLVLEYTHTMQTYFRSLED